MAETTPFRWIPGQGPDSVALARMADAFPKPYEPMGEAWFMSEVREMFPELLGDLNELADDQIERPLEELASGTSSFGPMDEWTRWYHYLLPRLLVRNWGWSIYHPVELLVTSFITHHPESDGAEPYPAFRADALATLGHYIMAPCFWQGTDSGVPKCFNKWEGPTGIRGWCMTDGLLSASLFFCLKYLSADMVGPWFQSVISIANRYWQAQVTTWLVGAHSILTGDISQPAQLPEDLHFGVHWNWSHALDGNYSGNFEEPVVRVPFLPPANSGALLEVARNWSIDEFFEELSTDPVLREVAAETSGLQERFVELYG